jgi:hypothetical protein
MRALLVLAIAACQIPTEHFIKPGGDGGGGDGKMPDSPMAGPSNAYAIDPQNGIFQVARDRATGGLTLVSTTPTPLTSSLMSVSDSAGKYIFVIGADPTNPRLTSFTIGANGALAANSTLTFAHCYPQSAAMHPTNNWIAVGCSSAYVAVVPITSSGGFGTAIETPTGAAPAAAAWSNDGKCLFFADSGAVAPQSNVLAYAFDPSQGAISGIGALFGPATASAITASPTANSVFVAGRGGAGNNGVVQEYQYSSNCALTGVHNPVSISMNAERAVVDPTGAHLYVTDGGLWAFSTSANGLAAYATNPYFATTGIAFGVAIHPGLPHVVYVTGYAYQGTIVVNDDGNGNLSQIASLAGNTVFLQLEP